MTRTKDDLIEEIMEWFNFAKVHKTMVALNWSWAGKGIPDDAELRKEAIRLLNFAHAEGTKMSERTWIRCGGFKAEFEPEYNRLVLSFEVNSWDAYD